MVNNHTCPSCGDLVPEIAENISNQTGLDELYCPNCERSGKSVIVAIEGVHISNIKNVDEKIIQNCETIRSDCNILKIKEASDQIIIRYLNSLAREEACDFKLLPRLTNNLESYVIFSGNEPIGYLAYNFDNIDDGKPVPCICQIFVIKEKRRMGYASELVKYLLKNEGEFGLEYPSTASRNLAEKLGWPFPELLKRINARNK